MTQLDLSRNQEINKLCSICSSDHIKEESIVVSGLTCTHHPYILSIL